jgi:hypothetical protein
MDLDLILQTILAERAKKAVGGGRGILRPRELDDPTVPNDLKASILTAYTAAITDRPASQWSDSENADVKTQIQTGLKSL